MSKPYTLHAPEAGGTYAQRFGWIVRTATGFTAYSGDRSGAAAYMRAMNRRPS